MPNKMIIQFGKKSDYELEFCIEDTPIADLWVERMGIRNNWPMDNPDRFYGFNDYDTEKQKAITLMNESIDVVNRYHLVIDRRLQSVNDQDTLNYLHNIFELYHGQLDQQNSEFWKNAPDQVRRALANININVHRCESLRTGKMNPRFICTWYGMPKTKKLSLDLQEKYAVGGSEFGGVYLNYVEIGKTAKDMAYDNDHYMAENMFQPFTHYSADFRVDLYTETPEKIQTCQDKVSAYFDSNRIFFEKFGITESTDIRIRPTKFKVAQLLYESRNVDSIMSQMQKNQHISSVVLK